jgi:hypothetical protein
MTTFIAPKPDFLPYGMWVFSDGSEVLFNRQQLPIWWRRGIGHKSERVDPSIHMPGWVVERCRFPRDGETFEEYRGHLEDRPPRQGTPTSNWDMLETILAKFHAGEDVRDYLNLRPRPHNSEAPPPRDVAGSGTRPLA